MRSLRAFPFALALILVFGVLQTVQAAPREVSWARAHQDRWGWASGRRALGPEAPWITIILRNRDRLQLTPQQIEKLEKLRLDFTREAIRKQADLRIAALDMRALLGAEKVNLDQVKKKLEESAKLYADLRFSRIQAIEAGKALLTPAQREKLSTYYSSQRRWGAGKKGNNS